MGIGVIPPKSNTKKCRLCDEEGEKLCEHCKIIVASNLTDCRGYYGRREYVKIPSIGHKRKRKYELWTDINHYKKCLKNKKDSFCWVEYCKAKKEAHESVGLALSYSYVATVLILIGAINGHSSPRPEFESDMDIWINFLWVGLLLLLIHDAYYNLRWGRNLILAEFAQHRNSDELNARIRSSRNALGQMTNRYEAYLLENAGIMKIHEIRTPETLPKNISPRQPSGLRLNLEHPPHKTCKYCRKEIDFFNTNGIYHESCAPEPFYGCGMCGEEYCSGCGDEF